MVSLESYCRLMTTEDILIESSQHGRVRRERSEISKQDLQAAVNYGERKPSWRDPQNW